MTPRAGGIGVFRLHHLTFPVADQTGAPGEYLAGSWVTSRSRRLVLTFSCSARIARHGDTRWTEAAFHPDEPPPSSSGLGLPPGCVLSGAADTRGHVRRLRETAVVRVDDVVPAHAVRAGTSERDIPEVWHGRLARRGIRRIRRGIHERRVAADSVHVRAIAEGNTVAVVADDGVIGDVVLVGDADQRQPAVDLLRGVVLRPWSVVIGAATATDT